MGPRDGEVQRCGDHQHQGAGIPPRPSPSNLEPLTLTACVCHEVLCLCLVTLEGVTYLIVGCRDPKPLMFNFDTGKLVRAFSGTSTGGDGDGHYDAVWDCCVEDEILYTASKDTNVKQWNIHNGHLIASFEGHQDSVRSVGFYDGIMYTCSAENKTINWNLEDGHPIYNYLDMERWAWCSCVGDGMLFVGTLEGQVCRWDLQGWEAYLAVEYVPGGLMASTPDLIMGSHANAIRCMSYLDGKLYTGSLDGEVIEWDAKSGQKLQTFVLPAMPPTGC